MILDSYNEFSDAQSASSVTASDVSTNVVDLGSAGDAEARPIRLHIQITEAFTGTGTTMTFALQTDTVENFASPTTLWTTAAIAKATLVAGYKVTGPSGVRVVGGVQQYLRLTYVGDDTFETTGVVDAFLSFDGDSNEF